VGAGTSANRNRPAPASLASLEPGAVQDESKFIVRRRAMNARSRTPTCVLFETGARYSG
jgi:hypothetical protein